MGAWRRLAAFGMLALTASTLQAWAGGPDAGEPLPCNALCRRWMGMDEPPVPPPVDAAEPGPALPLQGAVPVSDPSATVSTAPAPRPSRGARTSVATLPSSVVPLPPRRPPAAPVEKVAGAGPAAVADLAAGHTAPSPGATMPPAPRAAGPAAPPGPAPAEPRAASADVGSAPPPAAQPAPASPTPGPAAAHPRPAPLVVAAEAVPAQPLLTAGLPAGPLPADPIVLPAPPPVPALGVPAPPPSRDARSRAAAWPPALDVIASIMLSAPSR